jgi:hypothetical protein
MSRVYLTMNERPSNCSLVTQRARPDRLFDAPVDLGTLTIGQTAHDELGDFLSCRQRSDDQRKHHDEGQSSPMHH